MAAYRILRRDHFRNRLLAVVENIRMQAKIIDKDVPTRARETLVDAADEIRDEGVTFRVGDAVASSKLLENFPSNDRFAEPARVRPRDVFDRVGGFEPANGG